MVPALTTAGATLGMWAAYLAARAILSLTKLSHDDQIAMAFLAGLACLAAAGLYAWDVREKSAGGA